MREVRDSFGVPVRRAQRTLGEGREERRREEGGGGRREKRGGVNVCRMCRHLPLHQLTLQASCALTLGHCHLLKRNLAQQNPAPHPAHAHAHTHTHTQRPPAHTHVAAPACHPREVTCRRRSAGQYQQQSPGLPAGSCRQLHHCLGIRPPPRASRRRMAQRTRVRRVPPVWAERGAPLS